MLGQKGTRALEASSSTAVAHGVVKSWWKQECHEEVGGQHRQ